MYHTSSGRVRRVHYLEEPLNDVVKFVSEREKYFEPSITITALQVSP